LFSLHQVLIKTLANTVTLSVERVEIAENDDMTASIPDEVIVLSNKLKSNVFMNVGVGVVAFVFIY
jgi:chemotaxis protein CheY-P-specific phosphatase CheC